MILGPITGGWLATAYGIPTVLEGRAGFIPTPIRFQVAAFATLAAALPLLLTGRRVRDNPPATSVEG
jgi:hypothetical protein